MIRQTVRKRLYLVLGIVTLTVIGYRFYFSDRALEHPRLKVNGSGSDSNHLDFLISTPSNSRSPLHRVRIRTDDALEVKGIRSIDTRTGPPTSIFMTNLDSLLMDKHGPVIVSTNEKKAGELVRINLGPEPDQAVLTLIGLTGGDDPAFTRIVQRNGNRIAMTANYGSPTLSIHDLSDQNSTPPMIHRFYETSSETSHLHQIIAHPHLDDIIYVPDLGTNTIRVVRLIPGRDHQVDKMVDMQQIPLDTGKCVGPRHGVFTVDAHTLIIACQTSNTIVQIKVARSGYLESDSNLPFLSTLPNAIKNPHHHALSAIVLSTSGEYLFVANRQVNGVYSRPLKDTVAVYRIEPTNNKLQSLGSVDLDCWQPREMILLDKRATSQRMLVTCVGRGGPIEHAGAGIRMLNIQVRANEVDGKLKGRWDDESAWGITAV